MNFEIELECGTQLSDPDMGEGDHNVTSWVENRLLFRNPPQLRYQVFLSCNIKLYSLTRYYMV